MFELLSFNLYELIKQNQFKGLSINLVRVFTLQLLDTLILLKEANIIHCDLKPENILLTRYVKIILIVKKNIFYYFGLIQPSFFI